MNRIKKPLLFLALLFSLLLASCGKGGDASPAASSQDASSSPSASSQDIAASSQDASSAPAASSQAPAAEDLLPEDGSYTTKEDVALYLHQYGRLPGNFITKKDARALGWSGGSLEPYAPGMCIGGDRFGNYEKILPEAEGRTSRECDVGTLGASKRGAERIVFSSDGLIYYTGDHYESFELLYDDTTG